MKTIDKFNYGDEVLVTKGMCAGEIVKFVKYNENGCCLVCRDKDDLSSFTVSENDLEYVNPNYYAMISMATVGSVSENKKTKQIALHVEVTPDRGKTEDPYFRVLDTDRFRGGKSKAVRLHFKEARIIHHIGDGMLDWDVGNREIEIIQAFLREKNYDNCQYTNWQMACWLWNECYGFFLLKELDDYMAGKFDDKYKDHPSYVPSTQEMPKEWIYNPPKDEPLHKGSGEQSTSDEPFFEMAGRIPEDIKVKTKGNKILIVAVGNDENIGVSHFHVFRSTNDLKAWSNGACLMFTENKYFDHEKNSETLTADELDAVVAKLKEKPNNEYLPGKTYWEYIVGLWNGGNYYWNIPLNTPMTTYDYNTITRHSFDSKS